MSLRNGNWNENAAVWVTFGNGPWGFSQHRYILMHHSAVSPSWAEPIEKPLVTVLKERVLPALCGGDKCRGWLWHRVCFEQPAWQCLGLIESGWRGPAGTAGALLAAEQLCHIPDLPELLWGLLFTHSQLHLTHSCVGHLSYGQPHPQGWDTFRSYLLVCDAQQDMLVADGLMDFRSLVKLLAILS